MELIVHHEHRQSCEYVYTMLCYVWCLSHEQADKAEEARVFSPCHVGFDDIIPDGKDG